MNHIEQIKVLRAALKAVIDYSFSCIGAEGLKALAENALAATAEPAQAVAQSVNTPEFKKHILAWFSAKLDCSDVYQWAKLVAHIDAHTAQQVAQTVASRDARIAELEKDAARYRWLRHGDNDELVIQHGPVAPDFHWLPRNERLDAMIDAAIASAKAGS